MNLRYKSAKETSCTNYLCKKVAILMKGLGIVLYFLDNFCLLGILDPPPPKKKKEMFYVGYKFTLFW